MMTLVNVVGILCIAIALVAGVYEISSYKKPEEEGAKQSAKKRTTAKAKPQAFKPHEELA